MNKKLARLRRARKTRIKIAGLKIHRLAVHRTNKHIYAQVFSPCGKKILAAASTLEAEVRQQLNNGLKTGSANTKSTGKGGDIAAAVIIGKRIADKAKLAGITGVAFDRSGFRFHGRVAALAGAAREAGLAF